MPWIHLYVGNQGYVKACCVANITLGNINKQSIEEIWRDDPIKRLRSLFLEGKPDSRCSVCVENELGGKKSIRQETLERYPTITPQSTESSLPIYFDIRFSNVCNFKCRTCWHGASSKWFEDAKALGTQAHDKAIIQNVTNFDDFVVNCEESLLSAKEFYFAGGEPLIMDEHFKLLSWLIQREKTNVLLRYNTNLSTLSHNKKSILKLWAKFMKVELQISLDAENELGEYVRKGLDWSKFLSNIEELQNEQNIDLLIAPTISVFNIENLVGIYYSFCINRKLGFYVNILNRPSYYNIQSLRKEEKEHVEKQWRTHVVWDKIPDVDRVKLEEVLSYLYQKDLSGHRDKFFEQTKLLDSIRGEDYKKIKGHG